MGFHVLAYDLTDAAGTASNADSTAYVDQSFSQRNGHYIFTEPYNLLAGYIHGASSADARFNVPSINAIGFHHLQGVNRSATIGSPPVVHDLRSAPMALPMNEEISLQLSDNAGVATHVDGFLLIGTPDWSRQLPNGLQRITARFTASITTGAFAWAGLTPWVMETTLKGGWYSLVGLDVIGANLLAYQVNFPRMPLIQGRKLFPGCWAINALGNVPTFYDRAWLGWWGTFHTFELPQIQGVSAAGGAISVTGFADLIYHGGTPPPGTVSSQSI